MYALTENLLEQTKGQKRDRQEEGVFIPSKKRKLQPAHGNKEVPNYSTNKEMNTLAIRIEDTTCSYPLTTSQVFLFNALAVALSPEFAKNSEMRVMYNDSMSQVELATLSHLKDLLSLAHTKKCESMGLK